MDYMIVGGTSGIGLATAKTAIAAGHAVTVAGRDAAKCEAARATGADAVQLDACDPAACRRVFAARGRFDHLVLCTSGSAGAGAFRELALDDLRKGFDEKFCTLVTCAKAALDFIDASGSITFVGAISSRAMRPGTAGLAAINAALEAMVPILASELRLTTHTFVTGTVLDCDGGWKLRHS